MSFPTNRAMEIADAALEMRRRTENTEEGAVPYELAVFCAVGVAVVNAIEVAGERIANAIENIQTGG